MSELKQSGRVIRVRVARPTEELPGPFEFLTYEVPAECREMSVTPEGAVWVTVDGEKYTEAVLVDRQTGPMLG